MELQKIASFSVDHTKLEKGMYVSRIDGDITTYDIRMKKPNKEEVMTTGVCHTIEHLFATYARNSEFKDKIIYVGPMGCRTGFYLLVRNMSDADALKLTKDSFEFIKNFEGEIPGAKEAECGNYRDHDLNGAKKEAETYLRTLQNLTAADMRYKQ
jgi:S-ribosylhomocysteine lyase